MRKGDLNREQAIAAAGLSAVIAVENSNCDYTNRVQTDGDSGIEFAAYAKTASGDTLIAYYYQDEAVLEGVDDLGALDWDIAGYEIV